MTANDGEVKTYTGLTKRTFKDKLFEDPTTPSIIDSPNWQDTSGARKT